MKKLLVFLLVAGLIFALVPSFASENQANRNHHSHRFSWGEEGTQEGPHCPRGNFSETRLEEDSQLEDSWQGCHEKGSRHQMRRRMADPENCPRR